MADEGSLQGGVERRQQQERDEDGDECGGGSSTREGGSVISCRFLMMPDSGRFDLVMMPERGAGCAWV